MNALAASSTNISHCFSASNLFSSLNNYAQRYNIKASISVDDIGYPNVGNRPLINSLKRSRAVSAGISLGVTRFTQKSSFRQSYGSLTVLYFLFCGTLSLTMTRVDAPRTQKMDDSIYTKAIIVAGLWRSLQ